MASRWPGRRVCLGVRPETTSAEPPPETTTIRLIELPSTCVTPQYIAEELLHAEGFSTVQYLKWTSGPVWGIPAGASAYWKAVTAGDVDIHVTFLPTLIVQMDKGAPLVVVAGSHVGCFELFAANSIRSIRDLKGKTVAFRSVDASSFDYFFIASFVASVGLDPRRDLNVVVHPLVESMRLFAEGKIDAFSAPPPTAQEFRAKRIGHVLVDVGRDRPWSQYFCCVVTGYRDFIQRNPVATKRALRAILKATDVCALEPDRVAKSMVDKGYARRESYEYVLQGLKELPYGKWREYDAEDAVRFYALRFNEIGLVGNSPHRIIAQGTDWRFLNELKKELKG